MSSPSTVNTRDRRNHSGARPDDRRAPLDAARRRRGGASSTWTSGPRAAACCASTFPARCSACSATTSRRVARALVTMARAERRAGVDSGQRLQPGRHDFEAARAAEPAPAAGTQAGPCGCRPWFWCRDRHRAIATRSSRAFRSSRSSPTRWPTPAFSSSGTTSAAPGQSGGRPESATFDEFAADARAVFTYLRKRKDVDPKRIALVGYGEGGWIALIVGAREQTARRHRPRLPRRRRPGPSWCSSSSGSCSSAARTTGGGPAGGRRAAEDRFSRRSITGKGWDALHARHPPARRHAALSQLSACSIRRRRSHACASRCSSCSPMLDREVPAYHGEQLAQLAPLASARQGHRFRAAGRPEPSARARDDRRRRPSTARWPNAASAPPPCWKLTSWLEQDACPRRLPR